MAIKDNKRVSFRVSDNTYEKLENLSERWGMTINALVAYIVGRWADENYDLQDKLIDRMTPTDEQVTKLFDNPQYKAWFQDLAEAIVKAEKEN